MTSAQKKDQVVAFLVKELNGASNVKGFADIYRELNICDLANDKHIERVTDNGGALLATLVSWYTLGLTQKLLEVKNKIQGK